MVASSLLVSTRLEGTGFTQPLSQYPCAQPLKSFHPNQLSGGEQQRVAIARALANNPKMILADEPTASLDTDRALRVMQLLRQISRESGTAVLVVTHDYRMIEEVDRVIQLVDGRIVDAKIVTPARSQEARLRQQDLRG